MSTDRRAGGDGEDNKSRVGRSLRAQTIGLSVLAAVLAFGIIAPIVRNALFVKRASPAEIEEWIAAESARSVVFTNDGIRMVVATQEFAAALDSTEQARLQEELVRRGIRYGTDTTGVSPSPGLIAALAVVVALIAFPKSKRRRETESERVDE